MRLDGHETVLLKPCVIANIYHCDVTWLYIRYRKEQTHPRMPILGSLKAWNGWVVRVESGAMSE